MWGGVDGCKRDICPGLHVQKVLQCEFLALSPNEGKHAITHTDKMYELLLIHNKLLIINI